MTLHTITLTTTIVVAAETPAAALDWCRRNEPEIRRNTGLIAVNCHETKRDVLPEGWKESDVPFGDWETIKSHFEQPKVVAIPPPTERERLFHGAAVRSAIRGGGR